MKAIDELSPESQHVHDYCQKMREIHEHQKQEAFKVRNFKLFQYYKGLEWAYEDVQHFLWEMTTEHHVPRKK